MTNREINTGSRFVNWMARFTALYIICDAVIVGIAAPILRIAIDKMWVPFTSILVSGMVLGLFLYGAGRFKSKTNTYCLLFSGSISIYFLMFACAVGLSCIWLGYPFLGNLLTWIPYLLIGAVVEFLLLYMLMSRRVQPDRHQP